MMDNHITRDVELRIRALEDSGRSNFHFFATFFSLLVVICAYQLGIPLLSVVKESLGDRKLDIPLMPWPVFIFIAGFLLVTTTISAISCIINNSRVRRLTKEQE